MIKMTFNKTLLWLLVVSVFYSLASFASAQTDNTEIIELVAQQNTITADDLKFTKFQSCEEMETVLEDYIKDNFKNQRWWYYRWGGITGGPMPVMMLDDVALESSDAIAAPMAEKSVVGNDAGWWVNTSATSSTTNFSTTNTQVTGIDEADIIKSDGEYLYYYNQKEATINIIKTPLDIASSNVDLRRADAIANIRLPDRFYGIQLYLQWDNLVIIANRRRDNYDWWLLNNGNQVDVIVYDISNKSKPKLSRFTELDGNYNDSRLIWDKLYIVNQLYMDRYRPMQYWDDIEDVELTQDDINPKNIDIAYTKNSDKKNLQIGNDVFPYHVSVNRADCNDVYYILPTKDSIDEFGLHPRFTTVNIIDLASTENTPETTTTFGSTQTIHMATDNLYLTDSFYVPGDSWSCPPNARCIMPSFRGWQEHTLIHKLNVKDSGVIYQDSTLVNGSPLTQYSMDQWPKGNFRILTRTRQPELSTHLSILNSNLSLVWSLPDIEPGEEFKSSRYIWDKLYLVTFERTDPLFAIDMADSTNPEILGELVIPWFSTYLHPYGTLTNGVQYLLGLGRDTDLNQRWWVNQEWIKLDLYKIDYNTKDAEGHIAITQEYSETRWWQWSQSEAVHNPRMFVRDDERNTLVLPLHLQEQEEWNETCQSETDPEGNIIREECRNDGRNVTTFVGMKAFNVTPENGIIETHSFDYKDLYKQDNELYNNGWYNTRSLMPRVWYVGDVLYQVNGSFAHFVNMYSDNTSAYIPLDDNDLNFQIDTRPWWSSDSNFEISAMSVTKCLWDAWRTLYTAQDCRYCEPQAEVFEDYFAKLDVVWCDQEWNQDECSDADIIAYPTWSNGDNSYQWYHDLESLAELANCS